MRHNKTINHLGRKTGHRKAMLANMASSLIEHKRIETTLAKAKALRVYVEPLITKSKEDTTHSRRIVFSYLRDKNAVSELFREVAPKVLNRAGGYTRVLKTGFRAGDAAEMAIIELVDFNEAALPVKKETRRTTRRGRAKKAETVTATKEEAPVAATLKEEPVEKMSEPVTVAEEETPTVATSKEEPAEKITEPAATEEETPAEE